LQGHHSDKAKLWRAW